MTGRIVRTLVAGATVIVSGVVLPAGSALSAEAIPARMSTGTLRRIVVRFPPS